MSAKSVPTTIANYKWAKNEINTKLFDPHTIRVDDFSC